MKNPLVLFMLLLSSLQADRTAEEPQIREATFRHQFLKEAAWFTQSGTVFCLSLGPIGKETDPDDAFINRFAANTPLVRKASACNSSRTNGVTDKQTGQSGLMFRIESITWVTDSEVEVEGGYYCGGKCATGSTYFLQKVDGKWKVDRTLLHWEA